MSTLAPIAASAAILFVITSTIIALGKAALFVVFNLSALVALGVAMPLLKPTSLENLALYASIPCIVEAIALVDCLSTLMNFGALLVGLISLPLVLSALIVSHATK